MVYLKLIRKVLQGSLVATRIFIIQYQMIMETESTENIVVRLRKSLKKNILKPSMGNFMNPWWLGLKTGVLQGVGTKKVLSMCAIIRNLSSINLIEVGPL